MLPPSSRVRYLVQDVLSNSDSSQFSELFLMYVVYRIFKAMLYTIYPVWYLTQTT